MKRKTQMTISSVHEENPTKMTLNDNHQIGNKLSDKPKMNEINECDKTQKLDCMERVAEDEDINGRERLKRHRIEVAGRVWIPEKWGHEELLKEWADCSAFDDCLFSSGVVTARVALVEQGRRSSANPRGSLGMVNRY